MIAGPCGSCGTELPPNSKFCNECGAPVTQVSRSAEYKQVTVLFADVVHSMDIAAAVGPERLREIMTELVNRCAAVVQRYGGTVDKFTGDGIMAVFGAPVALENHALRACLAALAIQEEVKRLSVDVRDRDDVELCLRVGLNSGQVIAGEIGSGPFGYTTIGQQVGMAQRMESVAPPGGVMLSESTARLVEQTAVLADPARARIKGADEPVGARRLLGIAGVVQPVAQTALVGRRWELAALEGMLDRSVVGQGCVVGVVGPAGIGKSRLVAETAALARSRGVEVFSTYCESHTSDIPFLVAARLLRDVAGISGLDSVTARAQVRTQVPDADPQDLLLLDDFLGIADPDVALPEIDPDARRRRIAAVVNATTLARTTPAVVIVEDAHWIDEVSESILAGFLPVVAQVPLTVLITYRPEYRGALAPPGGQTVVLAPLSDSESSDLIDELLGSDPSVGALATVIVARAAGNPFFAEEIVRDLAERKVLQGQRGSYICRSDVGEVSVPATLQAAIAARIDRLDVKAKRTLNAAAVIGSRFSPGLLAELDIDPAIDDLVTAQLVDQVRFTPSAEYAFRHPLIRAVAYESQLKSDRAELHRRLAAAIEATDENASLIAEHLEAAGDLLAAYGGHMRGATWATNRDIAAAQLSWTRAQKIADALPADHPDRGIMRIAPRTMLCGIAWRTDAHIARESFEELRELCAVAGDKASLAIAMAGVLIDHAYQGRMREAWQLASEAMALIESVGDPTLTVGLSFAPIYPMIDFAQWSDVLRLSQQVIDLADGDPSKGNFIFGSPLALALTQRAIARYCLGRFGWRDDLREAVTMARSADPVSYAAVVTWVYFPAIPNGALAADDRTVREIENALRIAERSGDDHALEFALLTLGVALVHRQTDAERDRGEKILAEVREVFLCRRHHLSELPALEIYLARVRARRGDRQDAITTMRVNVDHFCRDGRLSGAVLTTGVLVETLLDRGTDSDLEEAQAAIDRLARMPADSFVMRDTWVLRLRALLARVHGDESAYRDYRDRYRAMATSLGFEGHIQWAEEMP
ncbi:AAA family ATPase [Mycobacterium paraffinicum]|nr:adenylate/guanylate cyclase domain-containing protein [Mycobacterium paraffinicum]MCV7309400.1 AAA family ATPase [Mycobacterium paraffinicum]